jgi:TolB protein
MKFQSLAHTFTKLYLVFLPAVAWSQGTTAPEAATTTSAAAPTTPGIYIKAGEASVKKSLMALPEFQYLGTPGLAKNNSKVGKQLLDVLTNDLAVSGYFDFIKPAAFLEDTSKVGLKPISAEEGGFKFDTWKQIGTEFLVRSGYKIVGSELTFETYLYYVPQAKLIFAKSYTANVDDVRVLAHTYANEILKQLTGQKGFFLSRVAAARGTLPQQREIFVMDWDGNNSRAITSHHTISNSPAWSVDGKKIAYRSFAYHPAMKSRNADLFTYDIASGKRLLVSYRPGINSGAAFMPDGSHLLLTISSSGNPDIYSMTLDGRTLTRLTNGPRGSLNVEPSPSDDGKKIAFSSDRSGKPMVYVMNSDGSNVKRMTFVGDYNATPKFSPDGKKIVFAGYDKGHFDIFIMDASGDNIVRLTSARKPSGKAADNEDPSFSPDGRLIMFTSNRTGHNQLYVVDPTGENEHRITFDNFDYYKPTWGPNPE